MTATDEALNMRSRASALLMGTYLALTDVKLGRILAPSEGPLKVEARRSGEPVDGSARSPFDRLRVSGHWRVDYSSCSAGAAATAAGSSDGWRRFFRVSRGGSM